MYSSVIAQLGEAALVIQQGKGYMNAKRYLYSDRETLVIFPNFGAVIRQERQS